MVVGILYEDRALTQFARDKESKIIDQNIRILFLAQDDFSISSFRSAEYLWGQTIPPGV